ncbi:MAG: hypothetical protein H0T51_16265 [Pirellulales bacterium]|nr:hypothetical protein [Pirellulales bacterium]
MSFRTCLFYGLATLGAAASFEVNGPGAAAQASSWNTNASGDFLNPTNWTGGVPGVLGEAMFARGAAADYTVWLPNVPTAPTQAGSVLIEANEVTYASAGSVAEFRAGETTVVGRDQASAVFTMELYRFYSSHVIVGDRAGSQGAVNIGNAEATLSVMLSLGDFTVGRYGTGEVNVSPGGWAWAAGDADTVLGRYAGSSGTARIAGVDANLLVGVLFVGYDGDGMLQVTDGGLVQLTRATLGVTSSGVGEALVTGAGSEWRFSGTLTVGHDGEGTLTVADGGEVNSNNAFIGYDAGSGVVAVDGAGSLWDVRYTLHVGYAGVAHLAVTNEGRVEASSIKIGALGKISGNASLDGPVKNDGVVAPNDGRTLTIYGSYQQSEVGQLLIELGVAEDYSRLHVAGVATLGGSLQLQLADGFEPSAGQSFDVLDFAGVTGAFTSMDLPPLPTGLQWDASNLYTTGVLAVNPVFAADFDDDGDVDADDLSQWQGDFGVNALSDSDGADFLAWQRQLSGATEGPNSATAATVVPEPSSSLLLTTSILTTFFRASRRGR